jgi:anti-sigma-K factor RskA
MYAVDSVEIRINGIVVAQFDNSESVSSVAAQTSTRVLDLSDIERFVALNCNYNNDVLVFTLSKPTWRSAVASVAAAAAAGALGYAAFALLRSKRT